MDEITISRAQLEALFKNWNADVAENGYATYDDPQEHAAHQADDFMRHAAAL